jgi:hypothetical protein
MISKYNIDGLKTATIEIEKVGDRFSIVATKKACEKMDFPFTDGKIFDQDGNNYKDLVNFMNDYSEIGFEIISGNDVLTENNDEVSPTVEILEEIKTDGNFETIQQIKNVSIAFERKFNRKPVILVELTITTGKFRPNGKAKKWIQGNLKVKSKIDAIKNKWLFLDGEIYAKEFTQATYKLV